MKFSAVHFSVLVFFFFFFFPQFFNWFCLLGVSFCNLKINKLWSFYFFLFSLLGFYPPRTPHPRPPVLFFGAFGGCFSLGAGLGGGGGGVPQPLSTALLQRRRTVLTENICRCVQHFSTTTPFVVLCFVVSFARFFYFYLFLLS